MAITKEEEQVTWPTAANSTSVAAGSDVTSETVTLDDDCVAATIHLKADNNGTPASTDRVSFVVYQTGGDPDGTGSDEYDTDQGEYFLFTANTNFDDPCRGSVPLPVVNKSLQIRARSNASTNSITVSATITKLRVS